ncbi:hypothetical protein WA026_011098 [Henosepilachna vigintioctopunctata]|uniref:Uncharacterized protein n=1 Tax=Henosepilachna vigintioctopunctata TaxID=420089 RepID=A0AAW1TWN3_9CUCU
MNENISKTLSDRREFISLLENELAKNEISQKEKEKEIESLTETINHVKLLGTEPQWDAMIPLGKLIYIPGKIVHTGEYLLEKKSYPYSFETLSTSQQTVDCLEQKKNVCEEQLEKFSEIDKQLKERLEHLDCKDNVYNLPDQIVCDKGVAVRVGEFYEILEFEDE